MHHMPNSVLWRLIHRVHRTLNKTGQDAIQHAMRTSNIINEQKIDSVRSPP